MTFDVSVKEFAMKKSILCLCLLMFIAPVTAQAQETAFERVMQKKAIDCGYIIAPPYLGKDPNTGKMSGLNYEMMEAIGDNLGLKINWTTEIGAGDVAAALAANKFDVICQTMWPSAARFTGMTFVNRPQFYSAIYAVVRANDKRFDGDLSKANVKSVKVVGIEGDFSIDLAKEKLPNRVKITLKILMICLLI
jgi:ABC-type amino acid transport substrate-binding protein